MSFIAVTFGYNQFAIFNIITSTSTLIDNIKAVCIANIIDSLKTRNSVLAGEINQKATEIDNWNKSIKSKENELKIEEEKENKAKKEEEEKEQKALLAAKAKGKKGKVTPLSKKNTKKDEVETEIQKTIKSIKATLNEYQEKRQKVTTEQGILTDKKEKLTKLMAEFKEHDKKKTTIKIELINTKGEKVNINSKKDFYADEYLDNKTVYELNIYKTTENPENEVIEPFKFDGFCMRTIKEDEKYEEEEKANSKNKKNVKNKK